MLDCVFSERAHAALGSDDKTLKLWDAATGKLLRTFEGHSSAVCSVALSPDGRTVLSGSDDKTLKLWDAATGKLLRTFEGYSYSLTLAAFSPDGRTVLSAGDDTVLSVASPGVSFEQGLEALDTLLDDELQDQQSKTHLRGVSHLGPDRFSSSKAEHLFKFKLWDVATGKLLCGFEGHSVQVTHVAFSLIAAWYYQVAMTRRSNCGTRPQESSCAPLMGIRSRLLRSRFPPIAARCSGRPPRCALGHLQH